MEQNDFNIMDQIDDASKKTVAGAAWYELQNIPLEKLTPNSANAEIYEMNRIDELAESICLAGKVLQNAVVTEADAQGNHTILAGHRRLLACQKLVEEGHKEFAEMPCMVIPGLDEHMQVLILIQSNSTTRVLSEAEKMRQAERATEILTKIKRKKKIPGRVRDIVAKMLKMTTGQLARYNVISKSLKNQELRAAFEQGKMGATAAYEAARLGAKGQAELAAKMATDGESSLSIRDVAEQRKKEEVERKSDESVTESEKLMQEVPKSEEKVAEGVSAAEPENEKKKYAPEAEFSVLNSAIREVIEDLYSRKNYKEQEADKCKEDGEERNEKIARAAADFYDKLIGFAEQVIDNIGNRV